jgi:galactokinase/mevalonate kinase-like predicted kinase
MNKLFKKICKYNIDAIKLLGSGDGGYLLIMASPPTIKKIALDEDFVSLQFKFDHEGTRTVSF